MNILRILFLVRRQAEIQVKNSTLFNPHDLEGFCAIGSIMLWRALRKNKIQCQLALAHDYMEGSHVFVIVNNKIADITASQFGEPKIVFKETPESPPWYWKIHKRFKTPRGLILEQKRTDWPEEQIYDKTRMPAMEL